MPRERGDPTGGRVLQGRRNGRNRATGSGEGKQATSFKHLRPLQNLWSAPSTSCDDLVGVISLRERIRLRRKRPAKMEIRAARAFKSKRPHGPFYVSGCRANRLSVRPSLSPPPADLAGPGDRSRARPGRSSRCAQVAAGTARSPRPRTAPLMRCARACSPKPPPRCSCGRARAGRGASPQGVSCSPPHGAARRKRRGSGSCAGSGCPAR